MASVKTSGSQTATLTTEHTLATVTDEGQYQLVVDAANLANGELLTLRMYGKARSTDTERLEYAATIEHAQGWPLVKLPVVVSPHHAKFTLEQNNGTGRAFPWAVYEVD